MRPIIRFIDVCKAFKYHGGLSRLGDEGEEGEGEEEDEEEEGGLKPGETRVALQNINISIMPGERVGVIGINGSGKTTLLKIVAGASLPTSGRVVGRGSVIALSQLTRPLNSHWDGRDNLRVLAQLLNFSPKLIDERLPQIARFAGMHDAVGEPVKTYSRGMYERLAFAAALELDGDIYISDDQLGVGDEAYRAKCFHRMVDLCQRGKTLLFATHRHKFVEQLCTRAIWLHEGEVRADGEPALVTANFKATMVEAQQPREDISEVAEDADGSDASSFEVWFKEKYGIYYPLTLPRTTWFKPVEEEGTATPFDPTLGGIVSIECVNAGEYRQVVANNETFVMRLKLDIAIGQVPVDIMLEVVRVRGKMLLYHSLLTEPIYVETPQSLLFEIPIDSRLLPDNVYLIQARAVLTRGPSGQRLVSTADLYVATNNCGPVLSQRARMFGLKSSLSRVPTRIIELDWRVVEQADSDRSKPSKAVVAY